MAKRGTINHPKTKRLARALKTIPGIAQGLLETFWQWVGTYARDGGISEIDIEEILDYGGWTDLYTAKQVICAMTDSDRACTWLDTLPDGRFYVHDWHEHSDDAIHSGLYKTRQFFANGTKPKARGITKGEADDLKVFWDSARFEPAKPVLNQFETSLKPVSHQLETSTEPVQDWFKMGKPSQAKSKPSQSQSQVKAKESPPQVETKQKLGGKTKPPAPATEGGNESPPLGEPEASPGTPMVMLVHGIERKRGSGIPDPATATDEELLAYAAKRRAQVKLDDGGGDAA